METNEANAKLAEVVIKVAAFMPGWRYIGTQGETKHHVYLRNEANREQELSLTYDWRSKGRLEVRGRLPNYPAVDGNHSRYFSFSSYDKVLEGRTTHITIDWDREPRRIAMDILRRIVPDYQFLFGVAKERIAGETKNLRTKNARIAMLCNLLGEKMREEWKREGSWPTVGNYSDVNVALRSSEYHVSFDIQSDDNLKKIVQTIRYYLKQEREAAARAKAAKEAEEVTA